MTIKIRHFGYAPSLAYKAKVKVLVNLVDQMVFFGKLGCHADSIDIFHKKTRVAGRRNWAQDGLIGLIENRRIKISLSGFTDKMWGIAHDLCHVQDLVSGNLELNDDGTITWMSAVYSPVHVWTTNSRAPTHYTGSIFRPVLRSADHYVPWEVKPSVLAEVVVLEIKAREKGNRINLLKGGKS